MANKMKKSSSYSKNLRRSAGKMASKIVYTAMPSLSETVVSSKDAFNDIKKFGLQQRSRLRMQNKYNKRTLLRPVNEIIENAKEDLKTGKFYNEERLAEESSRNMSDFLGYMSGEDEEYGSENNDSSMASFNKFMSSTSANSMNSARAISDTQIKTAEYLGELSTTQHTQSLVISRQQHLEQINKLDNLEKIGLSLAEFNTKTMSDHIKATHQFYNEILSETREMKKSIETIAKSINSRYGTGSKKSAKGNALESIFSGGSFNTSGYFKHVKNNVNNQIPVSGDMIKGIFNSFKASPISGLMMLASSFMMPSGLKKGAGKLDNTIQGLFGQYLHTMNNWKAGKTKHKGMLGDIEQFLGGILGVDMNTNSRPDLSNYKNKALTAEMEQKKAKAITEVIPSYLSEILKSINGKNMYFNYDKGMFEDRDTARAKLDKDKKNSLVYTMSDTKKHFDTSMRSITANFAADDQTKEVLYEDIDNFVAWLATSGQPYEPQKHRKDPTYYNTLRKYGLNLKGGVNSYKIIESIYLKSSAAKRLAMTNERMSANITSRDIMQRFNDDIYSSGATSLYNGLGSGPKEKSANLRFKGKFSDIERYIGSLGNLSPDEAARIDREFEERKREALGLGPKSGSSIGKGSGKGILNKALGKVGLDGVYSKLANTVSGLSDTIDSKLSDLSDKIASSSENFLYGEDDGGSSGFDFVSSPSKVKVKSKAIKAAKKTIGKNRFNVTNVRKYYSSPSTRTNAATQAVMASTIDYRPYFDTIDSHLRNIATILSGDKAVHLSSDPMTGSMTGMMSGASDKLKGLYSSAKESVGGMFNSLRNKFSNASTSIKSFATTDHKGDRSRSSVRGRIGGLVDKAKEKGLDFLSKIAKGISEAGGNVSEYFKSDSFKELLGGVKGSISGAYNKTKVFAGTLFDKLKSSSGGLLKKGKGMAIGGMISNMLGLGPIPGAIIGTLFSKDKKKKKVSAEDDKQIDAMEKEEKTGGGFLDKFKAKKKKSVALGATVSTMLGLGPIPGALVTMIFNKKFVKKSGDEASEEKEADDIADEMDKAEKKSKGIGKGKKMKNLTVGAMASSMLGLGPMPGVIAASLYNKHKDKAAKNKNKDEAKEAEEMSEVMDEATGEKKGGFLSKIKNFFGKGKNLVVGAAASTMLGLGPIPGLLVSSMYNKKKYKKNNKDDSLSSVLENAKDKELSKTAESSEARERRKKNKVYIEHAKQARDAEADGDIDKAERLENKLLNKAKADGDIETSEKAQSLVANTKNNVGGGGGSDKEGLKSTKKESLLSRLLGGGLGGIGGLLKSLIPVVGAAVLSYLGIKTGVKDGDIIDAAGNVNKENLTSLGVTGGALALTRKGGLASVLGYGSKMVSNIKEGDGAEATSAGLKMGANAVKSAIGFKKILKATPNAIKGIKTVGKAATTAVKSSKAGIAVAGKISKILGNIAENPTIKKMIGKKLAGKLASKANKIGWEIAEMVGKKSAKAAGKMAAKGASKAGIKGAAKAIPVAGWIIMGIQLVWGFISGFNDVKNTLKLSESYEPPLSLKLTSGIVKALDDATLGLLDLFSIRDNVIEFIFKLFASDAEKTELENAKAKQRQGYLDFVNKNPGTTLTEDKYNQLTNKTLWQKGWDATKKAFGKDVDTLDNYKTNGGTTVINYDASQNATVAMSGSDSGSGGRGVPLSKKSTPQIIKHVRDKLNKNIYSTNSQKLSSEEVNRYVNSNEDSKEKSKETEKKGFFNSVGSTITKAGKWVAGKISGAWNWLTGGSGGRGPSTYAPVVRRSGGIGGRGNSSTVRKPKIGRKRRSSGFGGRGRGGSSSGLGQPVKNGVVQGTGYDDSVGHLGVDIHAERGTPIYAVDDGIIDYSEYGHTSHRGPDDTAFSVRIILDEPVTIDGVTYPYVYYTHMQENLTNEVSVDSNYKPRVKKGDIIGYMGNSNGPHLHISLEGMDENECGHSNTMAAFGWSYNETLNRVGNAKAKPTQGGGMTNVKPVNKSTYNSKKTILTSIIPSNVAKFGVGSNYIDIKNDKFHNFRNSYTQYQKNSTAGPLSISGFNNYITNKSTTSNNSKNTKKSTSKANTTKTKKSTKKSEGLISKAKKAISKVGSKIKNTVSKWFGRGDDENYTYYSQKDPKWANQTFGKYNGKRDTVRDGGCGPTVAAMALEQLTGKQVLPSTMASLALKSGKKYDDGGTDPSFFNTAGSLYGVNFNQTPGFNDATIETLKSGTPVPLLGKNGPYGSGSHYLLATGIDNSGRVSILDPQNKNNNKKHSMSSLINTTNSSMLTNARGRGKDNKYVKYLKSFSGSGRGASYTLGQPTKNGTIQADGYGDPGHKGVDVHVVRGTPILACADATIYYSEPGHVKTYANATEFSVKLKLDNPVKVNGETFEYVYYTHMQKNLTYYVPIGAKDKPKVKKGDVIGYVGFANADHLHVSVSHKNKEGGHTNTMAAFGWTHNQQLPTVCNADNKPTKGAEPKTMSVVPTTPTYDGTAYYVDNGSVESNNEGKTVIQSIIDALSVNSNSEYSKILGSSLLKVIGGTSGATDDPNAGNVPSALLGQKVTQEQAWKHNVMSYTKGNITKQSLDAALTAAAGYKPGITQYTEDIIKYSNKYGIDPRFVATMSICESGWNTDSEVFKERRNPFGWAVYPGSEGSSYSSYGHALDTILPLMKSQYIEKGQNSLYGFVHPTAVGIPASHNYTPGADFFDRASIYMKLINGTSGAGGRGNESSILPYKVKSNIASMQPSIPDRMIYGRGGTVSTDSIVSASRKALNNKKVIKINKDLHSGSGRGPTELVNTAKPSISKNYTINKNNNEELMITALQNIVSLLVDIRSSNKTISEKNFSPVIGVNSASNGGYVSNSRKSALIDNIIAGI